MSTIAADKKLLCEVIDALPAEEFNVIFRMFYLFIADYKINVELNAMENNDK